MLPGGGSLKLVASGRRPDEMTAINLKLKMSFKKVYPYRIGLVY